VPSAQFETDRFFAAGPFTTKLVLPKSTRKGRGLLVPGTYRLTVGGSGAGYAVPVQERQVRLAAPPEGVAADSRISNSPAGPTLRHVTKARKLWARFAFAPDALPAHAPLAEWRNPNGRRVYRLRFRRGDRTVLSWYKASGRRLSRGKWSCTLKMGRAIIRKLVIRVG